MLGTRSRRIRGRLSLLCLLLFLAAALWHPNFDIIKKNSGDILKIEEWGLRNFSNPIKNNKRGYYFHIKFNGNGKTIEELEKAENIDEMLIRYLTVRVKKHDLEENFFEKKDS